MAYFRLKCAVVALRYFMFMFSLSVFKISEEAYLLNYLHILQDRYFAPI